MQSIPQLKYRQLFSTTLPKPYKLTGNALWCIFIPIEKLMSILPMTGIATNVITRISREGINATGARLRKARIVSSITTLSPAPIGLIRKIILILVVWWCEALLSLKSKKKCYWRFFSNGLPSRILELSGTKWLGSWRILPLLSFSHLKKQQLLLRMRLHPISGLEGKKSPLCTQETKMKMIMPNLYLMKKGKEEEIM